MFTEARKEVALLPLLSHRGYKFHVHLRPLQLLPILPVIIHRIPVPELGLFFECCGHQCAMSYEIKIDRLGHNRQVRGLP